METREDHNTSIHGLNRPSPAPPDDLQIKGAAAAALKRQQKNLTPPEPETCAICLEAIHERAVASPCNHLSFDFICLVQWLQEHATCPLCKAEVKAVEYDWRSPEDYKTYTVVVKPDSGAKAPESSHGVRRRTNAAAARRRRDEIPWGPQPTTTSSSSSTGVLQDPSLPRRRQVYDNHTPCLHVGANRISQYRTFTPAIFASSPALQTRARIFLRRELRVFPFLDRRPAGANREFLVEYVVAVLKSHDPKSADGRAGELLGGFLGREDAGLLLHELDAWLRSPFERLEGWDEKVQYADSAEGRRGGGSGKRARTE
jgi:hypothetical protein